MVATIPTASRMRRTWLVLFTLLLSPCLVNAAERVTNAQERAALDFLNAVASGEPQAVAYAIHPDELDALRLRLLERLRRESERGDSVIRSRLFGAGMPLAEIERLTSFNFYATLGQRLRLTARPYESVSGLGAIPDRNDAVHVVVRGRQPRDRGDVQVVHLVTLKPYGKDWKAAIPSEIEAQIDDLIEGRRNMARPARMTGGPGASAPASGGSGTAAVPSGITELLAAAEKALEESRCEDYYRRHVSPNLRRVMAKRAFETLISSCQQSLGTRQMLLSTVRIVRDLEPTFQYEGQRAVYDLSGQGLPYNRFVLEQVNDRWYVAE